MIITFAGTVGSGMMYAIFIYVVVAGIVSKFMYLRIIKGIASPHSAKISIGEFTYARAVHCGMITITRERGGLQQQNRT